MVYVSRRYRLARSNKHSPRSKERNNVKCKTKWSVTSSTSVLRVLHHSLISSVTRESSCRASSSGSFIVHSVTIRGNLTVKSHLLLHQQDIQLDESARWAHKHSHTRARWIIEVIVDGDIYSLTFALVASVLSFTGTVTHCHSWINQEEIRCTKVYQF